nr:MAG TPA: hypothetical protein [Caudoviricetes sp.]
MDKEKKFLQHCWIWIFIAAGIGAAGAAIVTAILK